MEVKPKVIILTRLIPNSDGTPVTNVWKSLTDGKCLDFAGAFAEFNLNMTQNWIRGLSFGLI